MKILVLCPRFPYPLEKGDKLRMYHQLRHLSKRHSIYLVSLSSKPISEEHQARVKAFVEDFEIFRISPFSKAFSIFKSAFGKQPFQSSLYYSSSIHKKIRSIISQWQPDHIYCQLPRMARYVMDSKLPKTIDYMDAFGVGMSRRAEIYSGAKSMIYRNEAKRMLAFEKEIYPYFDNHTIISEQDAKQIAIGEDFDISIVPNGIDTEYFQPSNGQKEYDIGFVGNMGYPPNIDAAEFLIQKIKPLSTLPLSYVIAGARPSARVKQLAADDVTITGWVDDIRTIYAKCKIFVAPLWSGTGQQNKILEAMAMGIPCITTSSVNNAIHAKDGEEVLVADTVEDFKKAIEELYNNQTLREKISKNALSFVKQNYSWDSSVVQLSELFEK